MACGDDPLIKVKGGELVEAVLGEPPTDKQQTWRAVTGAAPRHVRFGWKNFYVKDHPMLSPRQTMARTPKPVMISYQ